ncbi:nucleotide pyrophosphohydrolase [Paenibacillus polymyxa]|uniref:nucleotide pyrophosphohydrolase n=1 Tax=Paenibacillus polymyxa TaxID=1406 RepID=UPI0004DFAF0F|nr:nucleotide pyrophosphohydrolase [Paenibacillus polymyxa]
MSSYEDKIKDLTSKVIQFRDDRNWKQFHNPKDLSISLALEASELLENFQWKSNEEALTKKLDNIKEELADVLIYSLLLAHELELDVEGIILDKLAKNNVKYSVSEAYGSNKKYTELGSEDE